MSHFLLSKTKNGRIFKCSRCGMYHIEYKNMNFNFSESQYKNFSEYIKNINGTMWEEKNKDSYFKRKIIIPIGHNYFRILLNKKELIELKLLLLKKQSENMVSQKIETKSINFITFNN